MTSHVLIGYTSFIIEKKTSINEQKEIAIIRWDHVVLWSTEGIVILPFYSKMHFFDQLFL